MGTNAALGHKWREKISEKNAEKSENDILSQRFVRFWKPPNGPWIGILQECYVYLAEWLEAGGSVYCKNATCT